MANNQIPILGKTPWELNFGHLFRRKQAPISDPGQPVNTVDDRIKRQQWAESAFRGNQTSKAGAKGDFQIMQNMHDDYVRATGKNGDLMDSSYNRAVRDWAINDLFNSTVVNRAKSSPIVALAKTYAAYNWGRGNLSNFLTKKKNAGIDIYNSLDWLEDLPLETKNYVKFIVLNEDSTDHLSDKSYIKGLKRWI